MFNNSNNNDNSISTVYWNMLRGWQTGWINGVPAKAHKSAIKCINMY